MPNRSHGDEGDEGHEGDEGREGDEGHEVHEGDEGHGGPREGDARIAIVVGAAGRDESHCAVVEGHGLVVEGRGYEGQGAVVVDTIWVVVTSTAKDKLTVQAFGRLDL